MQRFGFAKIDITPIEPQYLAGYANRTERHIGVADHIYVRASAFEDALKHQLVIISFDLIGTPEAMSDEIYNYCQENYGLSRNMIVVNSIHTHCGPMVEEYYYAPSCKVDMEYRQSVIEAAVEAVGKALDDLSEAELRFGIGKLDFGINRRLPKNGEIYMSPNPNGFYLSDVPVLQAKRAGKEDTVLYSISCHPTTRGGLRISADYPGAAAAQFKGNLQFMQGAAGSAKVRSMNEEGTAFQDGDDAWLAKAGKQIVDFLEGFMASSEMADMQLDLAGRILRMDLPMDENKMFTDADLDEFYNFYDGDMYDYVRICTEELRKKLKAGKSKNFCELELRGIRIARNVRFLTISAEITAELAKVMIDAARNGDEKLFLLGYTGFRTDYLPDAKIMQEGGYEGRWAQFLHLMGGLFTPDIDAVMGNAAKDALRF
ncbi:MAG: neutral/alkaline non-lysosomal ceramidase N-terminal domain-containing protein [Victivallales bacterium]|nr:neutral/alkaline non-lysosomal ceramidase N-terminal domain-containing protein [Victivallales bacterium]